MSGHTYETVNVRRLWRPSYNCMHTGNKYLWFNPIYERDIQYVRELTHKRNKRMHIFISHVSRVNDSFKQFITEFFYDPTDSPVLTIHIPGYMTDLKTVIQDMVDNLELASAGPSPRIRIINEHKPVRFGIIGWGRAPLKVSFDKELMRVSVDITDRELGGYDYNFRQFGGKPGAVKNCVQAKWPLLFKDQIIASWKESCPDGILKTFKSDDEIWEFIMQSGEWDPKNGEGK